MMNFDNDTVSPMTADLDDVVVPSLDYVGVDLDSSYEIYNENAKYFRATIGRQALQITDYLTNKERIKQHLSGRKNFESYPLAPLPAPLSLADAQLTSALTNRRSKPAFGRSLDAQQLATLLSQALGSTSEMSLHQEVEQTIKLKAFPSAGGLYPVEFYVLPLNVPSIAPCLAHYDGEKRALRVIRESVTLDDFNRTMMSEFPAEACPAVAVIATGVFQRSTRKYGEKGYKFVIFEAGAACQTLSLVATAMDINSVVWSSFYDNELEQLLGIDGVNESVICAFLAG